MVATPHRDGKQSESKREDKSCEELSARPGQVSLEPFEQRSSRRVRRGRPKKRTVTGRAETGFICNGRHVKNREMWQFRALLVARPSSIPRATAAHEGL